MCWMDGKDAWDGHTLTPNSLSLPSLSPILLTNNRESRQVMQDYEFFYDVPYIAAPDARYLRQHSVGG